MRKLLLGGALTASLALAAGAIAQTIATFNLTGSEVILGQAGGPGGTGIFIPSYVLRNGRGISTIATATTVNLSSNAATGLYIATGAITTFNATLPRTPFNGQQWAVACPGGTISTLTISANSPASVAIVGTNPNVCISTLSNTGATFTYNTVTNTWYRTN